MSRVHRIIAALVLTAILLGDLSGPPPAHAAGPAGPPPAGAAGPALASPDGRVRIQTQVGSGLAFTVSVDGASVLRVGPVALRANEFILAAGSGEVHRRSVREVITPAVPYKRARIPDVYNEMAIQIAPCASPSVPTTTASPPALPAPSPYSPKTSPSNSTSPTSSSAASRQETLAWTFERTGPTTLSSRHPGYPAEIRTVGDDEFKQDLVSRREPWIARTVGTRTFPWRIFALAREDRDLPGHDIVFRLAPAQQISDTSWIRPGKSTQEWIVDRNFYDADFPTGPNTQTYLYLVDFAARAGLEYVMVDAGWTDGGDLTRLTPGLDIQRVVTYARSNNIRVILWTLARTMKRQMPAVLDTFRDWGAAGIMVDFMDRDDQPMVAFYWKVAEEAARRHLVVNFHGAHKPTGLMRAYPNVLSTEAVLGHEYNKWSDKATPDHNVMLPFTRRLAGLLDYEGGGMLNAQKKDFRIISSAPMAQGTRFHQLTHYLVFDNPLQFLGGNPSDYLREPAILDFFRGLPTTWDETRVLSGRIGQHVVMARRKGDAWYVGAITGWTPQTLQIPADFLAGGDYTACIWRDGVNADRYASDYRREERRLRRRDILALALAPGGRWVARITPAGRNATNRPGDTAAVVTGSKGHPGLQSASRRFHGLDFVDPACQVVPSFRCNRTRTAAPRPRPGRDRRPRISRSSFRRSPCRRDSRGAFSSPVRAVGQVKFRVARARGRGIRTSPS